jgi:hypothetical protein
MFKRLFGKFGKKNDGFYMQADESKAPAPVEKAAVAPQAKAPIPEKVAAAVIPVEMKASPTAEKAEPVAEESPKATKTSIKDKKKDKKKTKGEAQATPAVEPVSVATAAESTITNFATDYLIKPSSISSRRRPGANMKQFMDMARQVETKKSPGQRAKAN